VVAARANSTHAEMPLLAGPQEARSRQRTAVTDMTTAVMTTITAHRAVTTMTVGAVAGTPVAAAVATAGAVVATAADPASA
jgi:hypothetical protein